MTRVADLAAALRQELLSKPFTGDLAGVASNDLSALLRRYFTDGKVIFAEAPTVKQSADGASVVVSGNVDYHAVSCAATLILTPNADQVALALSLAPHGSWTLGQIFPGGMDPALSELAFASGGLIICSADYREPSQRRMLKPGMSLVAMLDVRRSYPLLTELLGAESVAVCGVVADPEAPLLTLITDPIAPHDNPLRLTGVTLTFGLSNFDPAGQAVIPIADAAMTATFGLSGSISGAVTSSIPSPGSPLHLDVAFSNEPLDDLSLLTKYTAPSGQLTGSLPKEIASQVKAAGSVPVFKLNALSLLVDTSTWEPQHAAAGVSVALGGYQPLDQLPVHLGDLALSLEVDLTASPPPVTFTAAADVEIAKVATFTLGMQTQIGDGYLIFLGLKRGTVLKLTELIEAFLRGEGFTLPEFTAPEVTVTDLAVTLTPREELYTLDFGIDASWQVLADIGIEMASVRIAAAYHASAVPPLSGMIEGVLKFDVPAPAPATVVSIELDVSATKLPGTDGWILTGQTGPGRPVPIGYLIAALAAKFKVPDSVPAALTSLTIENLSVQYDSVSGTFAFGGQVDVSIEGTPVDVVVTITLTKKDNGYSVDFGGTVRVGELEFDLLIEADSSSTSIVAVFANSGDSARSLSLHELVGQLSADAAAWVPEGLNIRPEDIKLVLIRHQDVTSTFLLGLDLSASFDLSRLPVVGTLLPAASVGVSHLQVLYCSAELSDREASQVNALLRKKAKVTELPTAGLQAGVAFAGELVVDGTPRAINAGVAEQPAAPPGALVPTKTSSAAPAAQSSAHWLDVQKSFGPVAIGRIGVQYQDGVLMFLIDASLSLAGVSVALNGLGFGSPLDHFELKAHLDGMAISVVQGPVAISGGFLAVPDSLPVPGQPTVTDEFLGYLTIAIKSFLISGVGAYATVDGNPSFFAFAEAGGPFGGPPAFYVTGFMGGFGYNWSLRQPSPDEVHAFPFVAGLDKPASPDGAGPPPTQLLGVLTGQVVQPGQASQPPWVRPAVGEMWLAAGIQFQSFKLVNGRALVVARLGARFELTLLGLATLQIPQDAGSGSATPYAYAELELEAVLAPDDGVFSVIALLTPKSYLLSPDCHLTGGFAFCLWFGDNQHTGDFVLTIGGYHPAFNPPPHYPKVPAVGVRWTVDDMLTIAGSAYFAITPSAAMAGTSIQVTFQSGDLRAWLTAHADILVRWNPFYVIAGIGITVGVSYRLNLALTTVDVGIEIGAQLDLWGPPTGGTVHVDWHIISFTISFGDPRKPPDSLVLDWDEFQALLPSKADTRVVLTISVSRGLAATDEGNWIVRPDELVLTVASAIPMTSVTFGTPIPMPASAPKKISIRPMDLDGVDSCLEITVDGVDLKDWPTPQIQTSKLPPALWGARLADKAVLPPAEGLIDNLPTSLTFAPPFARAEGGFGPMDAADLASCAGQGMLPFPLEAQSSGEPVPAQDSVQVITEAFTGTENTILKRQADILSILKLTVPPSGGPLDNCGPLTQLGQRAGAMFTEPPMLLTGGAS
jgi:hypothetical protein